MKKQTCRTVYCILLCVKKDKREYLCIFLNAHKSISERYIKLTTLVDNGGLGGRGGMKTVH